MNKQKFLRVVTPMIILLCILICIIYVNFQQSKLKIEEGFNLKSVKLDIDGDMQYLISNKDEIKDFYYAIEKLKEDKVTLKALEGRSYMPMTLTGEKDTMDLKVYDENVIYNNKVYGGKAVETINNLISKSISSGTFISTYLKNSRRIDFKLNEMERNFLYYSEDITGMLGRKDDLINFLNEGNLREADKEKIEALKRTYPSFDIKLTFYKENNPSTRDIEIMSNNILCITINSKRFYVESDKNIYEFIEKKLPKYELGDLGDLYKASSIKDKDTGEDLTENLNWLNTVITQNVITDNTSAPSKSKHTLIYSINGKNEEVTVLKDKIIFRGKDYIVNNVAKNYEVAFLDGKSKTNATKEEEKKLELKEGEIIFSTNSLLYTYIKDKEDVEYIDNIFDKIANGRKVTGEYKPAFSVTRKKNGKEETLEFKTDRAIKDGVYIDVAKDQIEKIMNKYITKLDGLKSMKSLVTKINIATEGYSVNASLSDSNMELLTSILSKSNIEISSSKPQPETNVILTVANGKNQMLIAISDTKAYVITDLTYRIDKVIVINNISDITKFLEGVYPKQNLIKTKLPIGQGKEVTLKCDGKTIDVNSKKRFIASTIWNNSMLMLKENKSLMDIGDKEIVVTFEYNNKVNTIKINKDGVYQNGTLMFSGRYQMNLIYNNLAKELGI